MLIASCRKELKDADVISDVSNEYAEVDLENGEQEKVKVPDIDDFFNPRNKILILVHGSNCEQSQVYNAYRMIEQRLHSQYPIMIGFIYPGGDGSLDWSTVKRRANEVADRFQELISLLASIDTGRISIMSHGLGARVVFRALHYQLPPRMMFDKYYCLAGTVDHESLEEFGEFNLAPLRVFNTLIFHSMHDKTLSCTYESGGIGEAIGLRGPEDLGAINSKLSESNSKVHAINCKHVVTRHGGYKGCSQIYRYIAGCSNQELPIPIVHSIPRY